MAGSLTSPEFHSQDFSLSRRDFCRGAVAATALALAGCGQRERLSVSDSLTPTPDPLTEEEFARFEKERKGTLLDPRERRIQFLVGEEAFRAWERGERAYGERLESFLERHLTRFGEILARTRPSSGIQHLRTSGYTLRLYEHSLLSLSPTERQRRSSDDVFGRWPIEGVYFPSLSHYWHEDSAEAGNFDDGLLHEMAHHLTYLPFHLYFDFYRPRESNWTNWAKELISLPEGEGISFEEIRLWREEEMRNQFKTNMLQHCSTCWNPDDPNFYPLAEPEELFIRRVCLGKAVFTQLDDVLGWLCGLPYLGRLKKELAESYTFVLPETEKRVRLYESRVKTEPTDQFGIARWQFSEAPKDLSKLIEGERLKLGGKLFSRALVVEGDDILAKAYLLVSGEGEGKKVCGFTGHHLLYWHYKAQIEAGEAYLGAEGQSQAVEIDLAEFE